MQEMQIQFLSREDPLEKEMATHSSILAWKIPLTEEPGGLQSMGGLKELDAFEHVYMERLFYQSSQLTLSQECPQKHQAEPPIEKDSEQANTLSVQRRFPKMIGSRRWC